MSRVRGRERQSQLQCFCLVLMGCTLCLACMNSPAATISNSQLLTWGHEVYQETVRTLGVSGTHLFAETASLSGTQSGGYNKRAYVWPESTQFRVQNALARLDPATYAPLLRQFSDELYASYWNNGYRSGAGGGARFYDDNAHVAVALTEAYRITHDPVYLDRARSAYSFIMQGEDSSGGGGVYFQQYVDTSKDAISTLQAARAGAMLYQVTGEQSYLDDALRLRTWANTHIQQTDGLYKERWDLTDNQPEGWDLINSAGIGISLNLELYDATKSTAYLTEAQRIANRSLSRYFDPTTGRINDEGYWAFELVDGLDNLYLHDRSTRWLNAVDGALAWLHDNKADDNGHYGLYWGRNGVQTAPLTSWNLNDEASVARAYLSTGLLPEPGGAALLLAGIGLLAIRRTRARRATAPSACRFRP